MLRSSTDMVPISGVSTRLMRIKAGRQRGYAINATYSKDVLCDSESSNQFFGLKTFRKDRWEQISQFSVGEIHLELSNPKIYFLTRWNLSRTPLYVTLDVPA